MFGVSRLRVHEINACLPNHVKTLLKVVCLCCQTCRKISMEIAKQVHVCIKGLRKQERTTYLGVSFHIANHRFPHWTEAVTNITLFQRFFHPIT